MCNETCGVFKLQMLYKKRSIMFENKSKNLALEYESLLNENENLLNENAQLKKRISEIENKALKSKTTYKNTIANLLIDGTLDNKQMEENVDECEDLYIASKNVTEQVIKERNTFRDELERLKRENIRLKEWSGCMENNLKNVNDQIGMNTANMKT